MNDNTVLQLRLNSSKPIQNLCVETIDGRIVVRGRSDSPHVRQLALVAIREAFEASKFQSERIEVDIEVD